MKTPDISIIVPCYNSGLYLPEAIESVRQYSGKYAYEIILIDDGSTDNLTLSVLNNYKNCKDIVFIRQENKGLSAARNAGCEIAKSEYLLFLDSDNKIFGNYIDLGIEFLAKNVDFAIVYGQPLFFGDGSREGYQTADFDIDKLMICNYIDACAVVRTSAWRNVGGFDVSMRTFEDYDLWLSLAEKEWKFHFINKPLYEYRIVSTSMIGAAKMDFFKETARKIRRKHHDLFLQRFEVLQRQNEKMKKSPEMKLGKLLLTPLKSLRSILK
ncbi:MAG: glycosyltransferase family 2 protein [Prevotellaceae bacterium]|jgi:glycosyltransferase involved in cell wall biosynthesis|nr:glycosyltransferase family 2 protein [Prevotellaceae bacterium]